MDGARGVDVLDHGRNWSNRAKEELGNIQSHLAPFMQKLGALSEEYELEKVSHKHLNPCEGSSRTGPSPVSF